jgi:sugar/nucleoside kinase (ribokinase family)
MKVKRLKDPSDTFDLQFPERKLFDVVAFGQNSVDHLCVVPRYPCLNSKTEILQYETLPGGQVATAAVFLARMGLKTKYIGKVGGDDLGRLSLQSLATEALEISTVLVEEKSRSQHALIIIDKESGERTILGRGDRRLDFRDTELTKEDVCSGKILHLDGSDPASAYRAAAWCQEQGIPVSADLDRVIPQCQELIEKVDFLITSADFPPEFTGIPDPVESFLALGDKFDGFLAVTLGAGGAMAMAGKPVTFPALELNAVDTTGAGDIFHGSFIYGLLQNWPLQRIMAFANAAAGLSCGHLGARAGIRPLFEILRSADQIIACPGAGRDLQRPV